MPAAFIKYLDDYNRLQQEYYAIPRWPIYHFIKQMINLRKRRLLTDAYQAKMREWGI